jgi:hypothetical protein
VGLKFDASGIFAIALEVKGCAGFGLDEFTGALEKRGIRLSWIKHWKNPGEAAPFLVIGTLANRRVQMLLESAGVDWRLDPEGLILQWCDLDGSRALVIAGTDDRGLMYNLLEMARRIDAGGLDSLNAALNLVERPQNRVRCVDRYLMGHLDNEWFQSEEFWCYLLGRMARARFNRFCLILGFDTPWMAPPYPYFLEMPAYPDVYVKDVDVGKKAENLSALRRIGRLCHDYGMDFVLATWQQRQAKNKDEQTVMGLPEDEKDLSEFCYQGIKALITAVPEVDIVQFRVNHESGVGTMVSAEDFWNHCADAVAAVADETGRSITLDLRAKGMTDSMLDHAFSLGLPVEVATKFWCEHAALPYHLSVMRTEELERLDNFNFSRRYSYADMLRKPKYYDVIFRLWNYGSTNIFLWGDADYARRFSLACGISNAAGFQINTPLALKYNHEPWHKEHWHTLAKPEMRSGKWEDERFWMWYTVYGRLGYNPDTDPAVWQDEFAARFGKAGPALERALASASKIVPFVTTIHMPVHPSNTYWTEMSTGCPLFIENNIYTVKKLDSHVQVTYGATEPSDHGLFYGVDEFAKDRAAGTFQGKYSPYQSASWLEGFAREAEAALAGAGADAKPPEDSRAEFLTMRADISMLCDFAYYHAEKLRAAGALALWRITEGDHLLDETARHFDAAIARWEALAGKGQEYYHRDLIFGARGSLTRRGTWADLTPELLADRRTLEDLLKARSPDMAKEPALSCSNAGPLLERSQLTADFPRTAKAGQALKIEVASPGFGGLEASPVLRYRHTNQLEGLFQAAEMKRRGRLWEAVIPADYLKAEWDLQVYITAQGPSGVCVMLPGVYHPRYPFPYQVITVTEQGTKMTGGGNEGA